MVACSVTGRSYARFMVALVLIFAVVAGANWWSRRPDAGPADRAAELITKPLATGFVLAIAVVQDPASSTQPSRFILGLVACLCGDVFLMLPRERFVFGLAAFLVGHLLFVVGFIVRWEGAPWWAAAMAAGALVLCARYAFRVLLATVRRAHRAYVGPIGAYVAVIAAMVLASVLGGHWAAPAGAAVFAVSDSVLASNKFVRPSAWAPLIVMATTTQHCYCLLCRWGSNPREYRIPEPSDEEIRIGLSSNLCRCTGYAKILEAVQRTASEELESQRTPDVLPHSTFVEAGSPG
ncbi:MAG: putative membrane protein YhhN [Candidatus Poriferisodalaceae bacterium]|jgi:uncharacterized membrane protein YhhN